MKYLTFLLLAALTGCQTVKVQGVEITPERQVFTTALLIGAGFVIADLADSDDSEPEKCTQYLEVPPGKDVPNICAD